DLRGRRGGADRKTERDDRPPFALDCRRQQVQQVRVVVQPRKAERGPASERGAYSKGDGQSRARDPSRQKQPDEQRPEKQLRRDDAGNDRGNCNAPVTPVPRKRQAEEEQAGERAEPERT